jgi:hypothetical protein
MVSTCNTLVIKITFLDTTGEKYLLSDHTPNTCGEDNPGLKYLKNKNPPIKEKNWSDAYKAANSAK